MEKKEGKVKVRFTEQQLLLLNSLKRQGILGRVYSDIVLNVFREYANHLHRFPDYIRQRFDQGGV